MEITVDHIVEMAKFAIKRAQAGGADGTSVNAGMNRVIATRFANSSIHQNFVDYESIFQLKVIKGRKQVDTIVNSLTLKDISWAVDQAVKRINILPDNPDFPGVLSEPHKYPQLKLSDPDAADITVSDVTDKIIAGINAGHEFSKKVQTVSGSLNFRDGWTYFLSSEGHESTYPSTTVLSTINTMSDDGRGESRSNTSFGERSFKRLPFEKESIQVAERSVLGLNAENIDAKSYSVILDHQAMADQVIALGSALSGDAVYDNQSFARDKVGEQLFDPSMTLVNDPHDATSLSSTPFDAEGIPTQRYNLINKGIIENFAYDRLSAGKLGTKSNGSCVVLFGGLMRGPFPLASKILPGRKSREQLISEMDHGLLITNLHYTNYIDMPRGTQTGMTKDGVFVVKNGEIIGSAKNLRFTDSILNMFSDVEISKDVLQVGTWFNMAFSTPAIQLAKMSFSSGTSH
ncbi:MAG: TldD/PmbA family protein [Candidatus Heimdallarchaeota archaeon]